MPGNNKPITKTRIESVFFIVFISKLKMSLQKYKKRHPYFEEKTGIAISFMKYLLGKIKT